MLSTSGLIGDWDGSSGSLADISGSSTALTVGSTPPTYSAFTHGWTFTYGGTGSNASLDLPASITGYKSLQHLFYINPPGFNQSATSSSNYLSTIIGPSGAYGTTNPWFFLAQNLQPSSNGVFSPLLYLGSTKVASTDLVAGLNVIGLACGTPSRIFINGVESSAYISQGDCTAILSAGQHFVIGSANNNAGAFEGIWYRTRLFSTTLSPATMAADSFALTNEMANLGVAVVPPVTRVAKPVLMGDGDSIMSCYGLTVSQCWMNNLSLTTPYNYPATATLYSIFNIRMQSILDNEPWREATMCQSTAGPVLAILHAGTNDVCTVNPSTPAQTVAMQIAWGKDMQKAGCITALGTMLSRTGCDAQKNILTPLDRAQYKAGFNFLIDFGADPLLGADGANTGTPFNLDHTHPSSTGEPLMSGAGSNAINAFFGNNDANPFISSASGGAITLTATQGTTGVPTAVTANTTFTLPSCIGQTAAIYRVNNPQSTYTVTVAGNGASQPINGLTTAIAVPSNGSLALRDVPNPPAVSGCHWEF